MSWRRRMGSLRARMALAFSALLLIAVAPSFFFLLRYAPAGVLFATVFTLSLFISLGLLVAHFTNFVKPLTDWARELVRGNAPRRAPLPNAWNPQLRELNHALTEGAHAIRHNAQALSETRELFEHTDNRMRRWADKTGDVLFELDMDGHVVFVNATWEKLTGFSVADAMGKPLSGFFCDDDTASEFAHVELPTLHIHERRTALRSADGRRVWVNLSVSAEHDAYGNFIGASGVMNNITQNIELQQLVTRYEDELYQLSVIDSLTGLYNRRHFDTQLESILADHLSRGRAVCLLLIDLDGFKFINDTYGHPFGDEVLRTMARLLRDQVRRNDYVARMAGNEFAMVLKNTGIDAATQIARKLHANINQTRVPLPVGHMLIQASIGVAEAPTHGNDAQGLVSAADIALYHGRRHGPNRVEILSPDMSKAMISIFAQGFQLRRALESGEIHPAFQPIYDLERHEPIAYEVLARMRLDNNFVQANNFIGVAQELGLTPEMDLHVIGRALATTPTSYTLFLNVDLQSLNDVDFINELAQLLIPARRDGRSITIEITERETVAPNESLAAGIQRLRALGCRLALDDFGSGYSTYKFLELFRPDYLKIEGSFVRGILDSESDRKIVTHIHELARSFGMETIAESVENAAIEHALKEIGIRNGQGLHLGAPTLMTKKEFNGGRELQ